MANLARFPDKRSEKKPDWFEHFPEERDLALVSSKRQATQDPFDFFADEPLASHLPAADEDAGATALVTELAAETVLPTETTSARGVGSLSFSAIVLAVACAVTASAVYVFTPRQIPTAPPDVASLASRPSPAPVPAPPAATAAEPLPIVEPLPPVVTEPPPATPEKVPTALKGTDTTPVTAPPVRDAAEKGTRNAVTPPPPATVASPPATAPSPPATVPSAPPPSVPTLSLSLPRPDDVRPPVTGRAAGFSPPPSAPPAPRVDPAAARAAARAADLEGIEGAIGRYRRGFDALDAGTVAEIWPAVDRRALQRAFAQLASQSFQFEKCLYDLNDRSAHASCDGVVTYVPKVGARTPRVENRQWVFALTKGERGWLIQGVDTRR